ncbi:Lacal_2735 family protein [Changchengzhania lutea]|uniref:Lacal_2735 family protein n=1 Tax=Changchengzhania lutea TaxID=2049305 RepID=UPI00115D67A4|nr:Lacal_2735 family protein [Changchengzhania lutea]
MFKLFKKKTKLEKLQEQYKSLMKDWHALSTTNRTESDRKYAEAEAISKEIEQLLK